jgi:hypothetical protein
MTRIANATEDERETDIEVNPAAMEEFEEVFVKWQRSFPICDYLAVGGTPDLTDLARSLLSWGKRVLQSQP